MSVAKNHIIHKQSLEVDTNNLKGVDRIHDLAKEWYYNYLTEVLEEVMDDHSNPDEFTFINELHIDLGKVSLNESPVILKQLLKNRFEEAYRAKEVEKLNTADYQYLGQKERADSKEKVQIVSKSNLLTGAFFEFLETSIWPLYYNFQSMPEFEDQLIKSVTDPTSFAQDLTSVFTKHPYTIRRLLYQFSEGFIEFLFKLDSTRYQVYKDSGLELLFQFLGEHKSQNKAAVISIRTDTISIIFSEEANEDTIFSRIVGTSKSTEVKNVLSSFYQSYKNKELPDLIANWLISNLPEDMNGDQSDAQETSNESSKESNANAKKENTNGGLENAASQPESTDSQSILSVDDEISALLIANNIVGTQSKEGSDGGNYIGNAGLALLNPYLEMFFAELSLVSNGEFTSGEARERALVLLHYLATGREKVEEHELAFNKVLCGMPIHEPVPCDIILTENEIEESNNLLKAIIRNWSTLKKTSPDGLRESFIMRKGRLSESEDGWQLIVEQHALDILLSSLPWGFNVVKLKWMESPVFVKWT
ncbi:MAG: contractile injection system tape measure protein [Bacteroidota bacterium]